VVMIRADKYVARWL